MKKILVVMLCVAMAALGASARDRVSRNINDLPAQAQSVIKTYFGKVGVNHIKIDQKTFGGAEYDVILNNGTEIEFDANGEWSEIDCGANEVPSKLILPAITNFVKKNYSGARIVQIERNSRNYEVELSTGQELKFARDGRFLKVD